MSHLSLVRVASVASRPGILKNLEHYSTLLRPPEQNQSSNVRWEYDNI